MKVYFGRTTRCAREPSSDSELIVEAPGGKPNEKADVLIIFDPGGKLTITDGFTFVEKNDSVPERPGPRHLEAQNNAGTA